MSAVEQELLPLCRMVFPSIKVSWELVEQLLPLLVIEIQARVSPAEMRILQPYTQSMQQLFSNVETKTAEKASYYPLLTGNLSSVVSPNLPVRYIY